MTFIDWSDSDEMLGLLADYVADERNAASRDPARRSFLADLSVGLNQLTDALEGMSLEEVIEGLRGLHGAQAPEFREDPVLVHVEACIEELERIREDIDGSRSAIAAREQERDGDRERQAPEQR